MPWGLKRYYGTGGLHFITWSCYRRQPLLGPRIVPAAAALPGVYAAIVNQVAWA